MNGFVRIHITLFKHSVDLSLGRVHDFLQALYYFPRPCRNIVIALSRSDDLAAAHLIRRSKAASLSDLDVSTLSLCVWSVARIRTKREEKRKRKKKGAEDIYLCTRKKTLSRFSVFCFQNCKITVLLFEPVCLNRA